MDTKFKTYFYNNYKALSSLVVTTTGLEQAPRGFHHLPDIRECYTIHFCMKGKGTYKFLGKEYKINKNDVFLIYPNVEIVTRADFGEPWEICWVGFRGSDSRLLTDAIGFSPYKPVIHVNEPKESLNLLINIYKNRGEKPYQLISMTACLYSFFSYMMKQADIQKIPVVKNVYCTYSAIEYITKHYDEKIKVEDIAKSISTSRSSLYRAFMDNFGISPLDYINEFKIKKSCNLLEKMDNSIKEVAYAVGFENPLYYSTVFKKIMGISPTKYRENRLTKSK